MYSSAHEKLCVVVSYCAGTFMNLHDEDGVDVVVGAVGMAGDMRIGMNGGLMIAGVGVQMGAEGEIEAEAGPLQGEAEALPVKVQLSAEPKLNSGIVSEKSVKLLKMCQLAPPGLQQEILRLIMTNRAESLWFVLQNPSQVFQDSFLCIGHCQASHCKLPHPERILVCAEYLWVY